MLFGLVSAIDGSTYGIGTLGSTGAGFYPLIIGVLMTVTGAVIVVRGLGHHNMASDEELRPEWRGWLCIAGSILAFIFLVMYTGLLPATFAVVFISELGDKTMTVKAAAVVALIMCVVAVVVFWWLLNVQIPILGGGG
nr:tripartite tricarboxylate transporter TctB family protein [Paralcaligenes ureilyticus]